MTDRAELIAHLKSDVQTEDCDCEQCELFRDAATQIEQDGKLIEQLHAEILSLNKGWSLADRRMNLLIAAAEAMKEAAAKICYPILEEGSDDDAYVARSIYMTIRALSVDEVLKSLNVPA